MNIDLNPGGLLGALFGGAAGFGIAYALADGDPAQMGRTVKLGIGGIIVGAIAANFLWAAIFGKKKPKRNDRDDEEDDRPRNRGRARTRDEDEDRDDDRRPRRRRDDEDRPRRRRD